MSRAVVWHNHVGRARLPSAGPSSAFSFYDPVTMNAAIVMPALNEAATIETLFHDIQTSVSLPIWLIDDCSTDATGDLASKMDVRVIRLPAPLGAWGATQTGLREAASRDLDFVVTMDADGQHNPGDIPALLAPLIAGECDVSIGSAPDRGSRLRRLAWRLMRLTSGLRCTDLTSGFRALNARAIDLLASPSASSLVYQDVGVLLMLEKAGLRVVEVPVAMPQRADGKSRIFGSWLAVAHYMAHTLLLSAAKRKRPWGSR